MRVSNPCECILSVLETVGADISEIRKELKSMIEYAIQFISLPTMGYKSA